MSNNTHRVQNIFISAGAALPANNTAVSGSVPAAGEIAIIGQDMLALDPAGSADTITTQPYIYIVEQKTDSNGIVYLKRSPRISGMNVTSYEGKSYVPAQREVWAIGYNRKTAAGTITAANSTDYHFSIVFKNYKWLFSERQEMLNVRFTSAAAATQLTIATQITSAINNSVYGFGSKAQIIAVTIGDGTGVYGLTGASNYGVEIWALDQAQNFSTTYTPNNVYFSVHVDDSTGFASTTTCTQIQAFTYGSGTYNEVYNLENMDLQYEGVANKVLWPIPVLDYSSSSTLILSSAIAETVAGTISEDKVTFSATVAAKIRPGEKVTLNAVAYEIKYFISSTVAILTTVLTGTSVADAVKVRLKYDLVTIDFNDRINTPTGVVAVANKSVVIAVPAIDTAGAYNSLSAAGTDVKDILDYWMASCPGAFANISI